MEKWQTTQQWEATKDIGNELGDSDRDDYFKHPEGGLNINIDKVASDDEVQQILQGEGNDQLDEPYEVETLD